MQRQFARPALTGTHQVVQELTELHPANVVILHTCSGILSVLMASGALAAADLRSLGAAQIVKRTLTVAPVLGDPRNSKNVFKCPAFVAKLAMVLSRDEDEERAMTAPALRKCAVSDAELYALYWSSAAGGAREDDGREGEECAEVLATSKTRVFGSCAAGGGSGVRSEGGYRAGMAEEEDVEEGGRWSGKGVLEEHPETDVLAILAHALAGTSTSILTS
jgi:hypothetical protein